VVVAGLTALALIVIGAWFAWPRGGSDVSSVGGADPSADSAPVADDAVAGDAAAHEAGVGDPADTASDRLPLYPSTTGAVASGGADGAPGEVGAAPTEASTPSSTSLGPPTTSSQAAASLTTVVPSTAATAAAAGPTTASTSPTPPSASSATTVASTAPTTAAPTTTTAAPTTPPPASGDAQLQQQILSLVNAERSQAGCGPLSLHAALTRAADAHSEDMAANNYFSHTGLNGASPGDRARAAGYNGTSWGENIAQGYATAESVMTGWMNSPGHRANILNCGFADLGVGYSPGNGTRSHYWTQLFGRGG
jgi:uncharacterized protein YkwD